MKANLDFIQAAGGLLWRSPAARNALAVVHRARYDDWSLPKGKLDAGERWREAALREVTEETGYAVVLGKFAGAVTYWAGNRPKVVLFWHMTLAQVDSAPAADTHEVDQVVWLSPADALQRLTYAGERALLRDCLSLP
jgi:8-oxo-dGTP diphosphatase